LKEERFREEEQNHNYNHLTSKVYNNTATSHARVKDLTRRVEGHGYKYCKDNCPDLFDLIT